MLRSNARIAYIAASARAIVAAQRLIAFAQSHPQRERARCRCPVLAQPTHGQQHRLLVGARQQHYKFIAAEPHHGIVDADPAQQELRDFDQHLVSPIMALGVVDLLEVIQVDGYRRPEITGRVTALECFKLAPVVDAGQRVTNALLVQGLRLVDLVGDIDCIAKHVGPAILRYGQARAVTPMAVIAMARTDQEHTFVLAHGLQALQVSAEGFPTALGLEFLEETPRQFVGRQPQHLGGRRVDQQQPAFQIMQENEARAQVEQIVRPRLALPQQHHRGFKPPIGAPLQQQEAAQHQQHHGGQEAEQLRLAVPLREGELALPGQYGLVLQAQHVEFALGVFQARIEIIRGLGAIAGLDPAVDFQEAPGHRVDRFARLLLVDGDADQLTQHPGFIALQSNRAKRLVGGAQFAVGEIAVAPVERRQAKDLMPQSGQLRILQAARQLQDCAAVAVLDLGIAGRARNSRALQQQFSAELGIIEALGQRLRALQRRFGQFGLTQLRLGARQVAQQPGLGRQRLVASERSQSAPGVFRRSGSLAQRVTQRGVGEEHIGRQLRRGRVLEHEFGPAEQLLTAAEVLHRHQRPTLGNQGPALEDRLTRHTCRFARRSTGRSLAWPIRDDPASIRLRQVQQRQFAIVALRAGRLDQARQQPEHRLRLAQGAHLQAMLRQRGRGRGKLSCRQLFRNGGRRQQTRSQAQQGAQKSPGPDAYTRGLDPARLLTANRRARRSSTGLPETPPSGPSRLH